MYRDALLFLIFLFSTQEVIQGRGTWSASGQNEYYVSPGGESKPYDEAQAYCKGQGGELALVKTQEVQLFIQSLVADNSGQPYGFFIGLRDIGANGTFIWNDGDVLSYTNWSTGEPNAIGIETCVIMGWIYTYHANLPWYDVKCTTGANGPRGLVCQRQIGKLVLDQWASWSECSSTCQPGTRTRKKQCHDTGRPGPDQCAGGLIETESCSTDLCTEYSTENMTCTGDGALLASCRVGQRGLWYELDDYQYYVSNAGVNVTYQEAKANCENNSTEIGQITSAETQDLINRIVQNGSGLPYSFYIGLTSPDSSGTFIWSNGETLSYTNWATGQPDNIGTDTCATAGLTTVYTSGLPWQSHKCVPGSDGSVGFICQRYIGWGPWSTWSTCSSSCQPGIEIRRRSCALNEDCYEFQNETRPCATNLCTSYSEEMINCNGTGQVPDGCLEGRTWSSWGSWSECSSPCSPGFWNRTRNCINNSKPGFDGCEGKNMSHEIGICNGDVIWTYISNQLFTCGSNKTAIPEECLRVAAKVTTSMTSANSEEATTTATAEITTTACVTTMATTDGPTTNTAIETTLPPETTAATNVETTTTTIATTTNDKNDDTTVGTTTTTIIATTTNNKNDDTTDDSRDCNGPETGASTGQFAFDVISFFIGFLIPFCFLVILGIKFYKIYNELKVLKNEPGIDVAVLAHNYKAIHENSPVEDLQENGQVNINLQELDGKNVENNPSVSEQPKPLVEDLYAVPNKLKKKQALSEAEKEEDPYNDIKV